jgi:hypothetical protein
MSQLRIPRAVLLFAACMVVALPALAVTSTTIIVTDHGQPVPHGSIRLVETTTNTEIKIPDQPSGGCIVVPLEKGKYRVEIGGKTANEFTVTGDGTQRVAFDITGGTTPEDCAPSATKKKIDKSDAGRG